MWDVEPEKEEEEEYLFCALEGIFYFSMSTSSDQCKGCTIESFFLLSFLKPEYQHMALTIREKP